MKNKDLLRLGGQKWRKMSSAEKMPYVKAAKLAQQQSQQNIKNEQQTKSKSPDGDVSKKSDNEQRKKEREVYICSINYHPFRV